MRGLHAACCPLCLKMVMRNRRCVVRSESHFIGCIAVGVAGGCHAISGCHVIAVCRLCGWPGRDWGYLQGCSFAQDKCLDSNRVSTGTPAHFCSTLYSANQPYCSVDRCVRYCGRG